MIRECELCGQPVTGKARFCDECKKKKQRKYFKNRYNTDEAFRQKYLKHAEKQRRNKVQLGALYDYSPHFCGDFEREAQIVKNMKRKTFRKQRGNNESKPQVYENYFNAQVLEEERLEQIRECPHCGGTKFVRENGEIYCKQCGLVFEIIRMSAFPR